MCGRFTLTPSAYALLELLGLDIAADLLRFMPRTNISPTQPVGVLRRGADGTREWVDMRWGLVPPWAKDLKGAPLINARAETIAEKPTFRGAFKARRCLVPATGYYEWTDPETPRGKKVPHHFTMPDGKPFAMAGIWETWQGEDGASMETVSLVTTAANPSVAPIHHRMPAIIDKAAFDVWLSTPPAEAARLLGLLQPWEGDLVAASPADSAALLAADAPPAKVAPPPTQLALGLE